MDASLVDVFLYKRETNKMSLVVVEALVFVLVVYFAYPYVRYTPSNRKILALCQPFTPCVIDELDFKGLWNGLMPGSAVLDFATDRPSKDGMEKLRKSGRKYQIARKRNLPLIKDIYEEDYFEV